MGKRGWWGLLLILVLSPGLAAPGFDLPGLEGPVRSADLRGQVVYVDFWASWCAPCRRSFPWMAEMQRKYGDQGFTVVAINLDKERELAMRFLEEMEVNFTIAFDPEALTAQAFKVVGMPSAYILGRDGQLLAEHAGFRVERQPEYEQSIVEALKEQP